MNLMLLTQKAERGALTCSEVLDLLMNQPTTPVDRNIESHAHMHMREGFKLSDYGFGGDAFSLERKRLHWETDSHLYPEGTDADYGRLVYRNGTGRSHGIYGGVFQDPNRLPPDRSYVNRTGLGELPPEVRSRKITYRVFKYPPDKMGKPSAIDLTDVTETQVRSLTPVGRKPGHYVPSRSHPTEPDFREIVDEEVTPRVAPSPAHTMFPDGESLVMHLTAALDSNAGVMVLRKLLALGPGSNKTVGIFSNSAARAVKQAHPQRKNVMIERTLDVDTTATRDPNTGFYPATGRVNRAEVDIDHVEIILGHRGTGELNVITCYPSKLSTGDSIQVPTSKYQDVAELDFRTDLRKVTQVMLPRLVW